MLSRSYVSEYIDNMKDLEIKSPVLNSESRNKQSILIELSIQKERIELEETEKNATIISYVIDAINIICN